MITATRLKKILGLSRKEYLNLIYRHKEIQDKETGKKMVKLSANQFLKPKKKEGGEYLFENIDLIKASAVHLFRKMGASYEEIEKQFFFGESGYTDLIFIDDLIKKNEKKIIEIQLKLDAAVVLKQAYEWYYEKGLNDSNDEHKSKLYNYVKQGFFYPYSPEYIRFLKEYGVKRYFDNIFNNMSLFEFIDNEGERRPHSSLIDFLNDPNNVEVIDNSFKTINMIRKMFSYASERIGRNCEDDWIEGFIEGCLAAMNNMNESDDYEMSKEDLLSDIYHWENNDVFTKEEKDYFSTYMKIFISEYPLGLIKKKICNHIEKNYPNIVLD